MFMTWIKTIVDWRLIGFFVLCTAIAMLLYMLNHQIDQTRLYRAAYEQAFADVRAQNDAINRLEHAAQDQAERHATELASARQNTKTAGVVATRILTTPVPVGVDACAAARALFDLEMTR